MALAAGLLAPAAPAFADTRVEFDVDVDRNAVLKVSSDEPVERYTLTKVGDRAPFAEATATTPGTFADLRLTDLQHAPLLQLFGPGQPADAAMLSMPRSARSCTDANAFLALRAGWSVPTEAGVLPADGGAPVRGTVQDPKSTWYTVALPRPLGDGDVAYTVTESFLPHGRPENARVHLRSTGRSVPSPFCQNSSWVPAPPASDQVAPLAPAPTPTPAAPTADETRAAVRAALTAPAGRLRTARLSTSVTLPFAFPEAGRTDLRLRLGKTLLGRGSVTTVTAGQARIAIALSARARKRLAARKRPQLTLSATFTPARADARPQSASVTVRRSR